MFPLRRYFSRYDGYSPLHGHSPSWKPNYRMLGLIFLTFALIVTSFVFNIIWIVRSLHQWQRPLDDYQSLNTSPFWDENITVPVVPEENAIVTTLYTDSYAPAVAALGHSLRKVNTTARLILLYFPSKISPSALCLATSSGFAPRPVERISPPHRGKGLNPQYMDQFTKLSLWSLDTIGIRALVYLDADTLVLRNFDEIFGMPYRFAAVPDVWVDWRGFTLEFNAGVMFLRPQSSIFRHMVEELPTARFPARYGEQAYLNQYFAADAIRLPLVYNGNLATKLRSPKLWEGMRDTMRVIHYTITKPFVGPHPKYERIPIDRLPARVNASSYERHGAFKEEVALWGQMWEQTREAYAQKLNECAKLAAQPNHGY